MEFWSIENKYSLLHVGWLRNKILIACYWLLLFSCLSKTDIDDVEINNRAEIMAPKMSLPKAASLVSTEEEISQELIRPKYTLIERIFVSNGLVSPSVSKIWDSYMWEDTITSENQWFYRSLLDSDTFWYIQYSQELPWDSFGTKSITSQDIAPWITFRAVAEMRE